MKTAAVAIDKWKLPIFKKTLKAAGFKFTMAPGVTPDTLTLHVKCELLAHLQPVIEQANMECAKKPQNINALTQESPAHAQMLEQFKDQLLIVLIKRLGGTVEIPVAETDDTGSDVLMMAFDVDQGHFTFEARKKQ